MRDKIVLIDHEPFTKRRKELFFVDRFFQEGYKFEVWSVAGLLKMPGTYIDRVSDNYVFEINTSKDLRERLNKERLNRTIFIVEVNSDGWRVYNILKRYELITIRINFYANTIGATYGQENWIIRVFFKGNFKKLLIGKLCELKISLIKKLGLLKDFDLFFSSKKEIGITNQINHPDYEKWRWGDNTKSLINSKYFVFCDNFFPDHPDLQKYHYNINGALYRKTLCRFFGYLENLYNIPVIIAAHPKAIYTDSDWDNRQIVKYKTDELVRCAEGVIIHQSNSISYSILCDKPLCMITTDDYNRVTPLRAYFSAYKQLFDLPIYNLDHQNYEGIKFSKIEESKRKKYIYTYLTSPETQDLHNFDIINSVFKGL